MTATGNLTGVVTGIGRVKQVLASVVLLIATIGVPAGLGVSVGWPLPTNPGALERLPLLLSQPLASSAVVDVLAVIAWLAWVHFVAGVAVELVNATTRRGRPQLRLPFGGPSHDLARSLVLTALLVGVAAPGVAAPAVPATSAAAAAAPAVATAPVVAAPLTPPGSPARAIAAMHTVSATTVSAPSDASAAPADADESASASAPSYVVPAPAAGRYACLWDIAEQQLGDGTRWTEIHDLNAGRVQPDGQTLTDPDLIRPGWRLVLPPDARHTGSGPSATQTTPDWSASVTSAPTGHLVVPGDTLWAIAETELGDGARYDELAAAAATLTQPDGQVLRDPDVLQPGWTIPLPTPATSEATSEASTEASTEAPNVDDARTEPDGSTATPDQAPRQTLGPTPAQISGGSNGALAPANPGPAPPHPTAEEPETRGNATEAAGDQRRGDSSLATDPEKQLAPERPEEQDGAGNNPANDTGQAHGADSESDRDVEDVAPAWALPGLSGAGTMLAGALLLLLQQHRRRQSRLRRPGRTLAMPDSQDVVVEKSVRAHTHTATTIERLDQILRRLAAACLRSDTALPAVVVISLDRTGVTVHLAAPNQASEPWTTGPHPMTWHLPPEVDLDQVGPLVPDQPAPFPLLVTVGVTPTGATTMLNLEHLGVATVTGDRQRGEDLLRYIAAEIGCNPWSQAARVDCIGVATELGPLNPERIRVTPAPDHADTPSAGPGREPRGTVDPVADLAAEAVAVVDRSDHLDLDVPDARIGQAGDETWPPHLLLLDSNDPPAALDTLADLIRSHPARTGTTLLMLATTDTTTNTSADTADVAKDSDRVSTAHPDTVRRATSSTAGSPAATDPTLHISPAAQLTVTDHAGTVIAGVTATGLSAAEAQGCAALYALGPADAPMPARPHSHGWRAYADEAGALTGAHSLPRYNLSVTREERETTDTWEDHGIDDLDHNDLDHNDLDNDDPRHEERGGHDGWNDGGNDEGNEPGAGSVRGGEPDTGALGQGSRRARSAAAVLGGPDDEYLDVAATTREDLDALAPAVPGEVSRAVADSDPGLDDDVAAWFADSCSLPRLTLLGPVGARTRGVPVTKRKPYYTELLAYLATRPHGARPEEVADAFDITATKARGYVATVRDWLGTNPRTGRPHIPDARHSPAAEHRGVGVYEVQDLLVDADLFRRLRLRGQTRGADGIQDLKRALTLVTGPPFSKLRPGGWTWLVEGDRLDQYLLCAVVDVAHLVTTHLLHTGELNAARACAELAALASPDEEIPRLDLAAVAMASGHRNTAADIIQKDVCNRADDAGPPDELSARTHAILERHGWLTDHRQAAS